MQAKQAPGAAVGHQRVVGAARADGEVGRGVTHAAFGLELVGDALGAGPGFNRDERGTARKTTIDRGVRAVDDRATFRAGRSTFETDDQLLRRRAGVGRSACSRGDGEHRGQHNRKQHAAGEKPGEER